MAAGSDHDDFFAFNLEYIQRSSRFPTGIEVKWARQTIVAVESVQFACHMMP